MPSPFLAIEASPAWHIAMPPGGGIHSITTRHEAPAAKRHPPTQRAAAGQWGGREAAIVVPKARLRRDGLAGRLSIRWTAPVVRLEPLSVTVPWRTAAGSDRRPLGSECRRAVRSPRLFQGLNGYMSLGLADKIREGKDRCTIPSASTSRKTGWTPTRLTPAGRGASPTTGTTSPGSCAGPAASTRRSWSARRPAPVTGCSNARWPGPGSASTRRTRSGRAASPRAAAGSPRPTG